MTTSSSFSGQHPQVSLHRRQALGSGDDVQEEILGEFIDLIVPARHLVESTVGSPMCLQVANFQEDFIGPNILISPPLSRFGSLLITKTTSIW